MSQQVTIYASAPVRTQLAAAFVGLERRGWRVVLRPPAELPHTPQPKGGPARG